MKGNWKGRAGTGKRKEKNATRERNEKHDQEHGKKGGEKREDSYSGNGFYSRKSLENGRFGSFTVFTYLQTCTGKIFKIRISILFFFLRSCLLFF